MSRLQHPANIQQPQHHFQSHQIDTTALQLIALEYKLPFPLISTGHPLYMRVVLGAGSFCNPFDTQREYTLPFLLRLNAQRNRKKRLQDVGKLRNALIGFQWP